jgi:hypothetical protein
MQWPPTRLGPRSLKDFERVDADLAEDDGQLVHQRDVQVSLCVLDHLGGLGNFYARSAVYAGLDHGPIDSGNLFQRLWRVAGDDLGDSGESVFLVAGIDALWRIAHVEILEPLHSGILFEHRNAHLFSGARIDSRLVHHHGAAFHMLADGSARSDERRKIGPAGRVDGSRHRNDDDIRRCELLRVRGDMELSRAPEIFARDLAGRVDVATIACDLLGAQIVAYRAKFLAELHRERQTDIAKPYDCYYTHAPPRFRL